MPSTVGDVYRIGVAVRDLAAAEARVRQVLGVEPTVRFSNPRQRVTCVCFPLGGCVLELIQSTSPTGPVARFIERRGEGLYLIGTQVANLDSATQAVRERGGEIILSEPEPFTPGGRHNFVHPRSLLGLLVEMVEP